MNVFKNYNDHIHRRLISDTLEIILKANLDPDVDPSILVDKAMDY